eukprot:3525028-Amphidinium_carterae.1
MESAFRKSTGNTNSPPGPLGLPRAAGPHAPCLVSRVAHPVALLSFAADSHSAASKSPSATCRTGHVVHVGGSLSIVHHERQADNGSTVGASVSDGHANRSTIGAPDLSYWLGPVLSEGAKLSISSLGGGTVVSFSSCFA